MKNFLFCVTEIEDVYVLFIWYQTMATQFAAETTVSLPVIAKTYLMHIQIHRGRINAVLLSGIHIFNLYLKRGTTKRAKEFARK